MFENRINTPEARKILHDALQACTDNESIHSATYWVENLGVRQTEDSYCRFDGTEDEPRITLVIDRIRYLLDQQGKTVQIYWRQDADVVIDKELNIAEIKAILAVEREFKGTEIKVVTLATSETRHMQRELVNWYIMAFPDRNAALQFNLKWSGHDPKTIGQG